MTSKPSVTIQRGFPGNKTYTWSPFVTKLEFRLRYQDVKYSYGTGTFQESPRSKIPWITLQNFDGDGGKVENLPDSELIIGRLVKEGVLSDLNDKLDRKDKALDAGIKALLEDRLFFYNLHEMWERNYAAMRDHLLKDMNFVLRHGIAYMVWRSMRSMLYTQGTDRFTWEEIQRSQREVWQTVSELLIDAKKSRKDKDGVFWVLGGDEPTEADASLFGFVIQFVIGTALPELREIVDKDFPVVVEYATRIHERYFSDYEKWN